MFPFNLLSSSQWFVVAIFAVLFLLTNIGPLMSLLGNVKLPSIGSASGSNDEYQDMLALHRLEARFERLGCKAGKEAIETAGTHFFHKQGDDAA